MVMKLIVKKLQNYSVPIVNFTILWNTINSVQRPEIVPIKIRLPKFTERVNLLEFVKGLV